MSKSDPSFFGDVLTVPPPMFSEDLASNIAATRSFLHNCFEKQPSQDDFEAMLAFNMMVPPRVRANMAGGTLRWCWCRSLLRCWRCSGGRLLTAALVAEISEITSRFAKLQSDY